MGCCVSASSSERIMRQKLAKDLLWGVSRDLDRGCRGRLEEIMRTPVLSSLALLALTACDRVGPRQPLAHSAAMFWCGPADGPATVIVLADEPVQTPQPLYP